jgi:hypothetical protein
MRCQALPRSEPTQVPADDTCLCLVSRFLLLLLITGIQPAHGPRLHPVLRAHLMSAAVATMQLPIAALSSGQFGPHAPSQKAAAATAGAARQQSTSTGVVVPWRQNVWLSCRCTARMMQPPAHCLTSLMQHACHWSCALSVTVCAIHSTQWALIRICDFTFRTICLIEARLYSSFVWCITLLA